MPTKAQLRERITELEEQLDRARLAGLPVPGTLGYAFGSSEWCNLTPYGADARFASGTLYLAVNGGLTALGSVAPGDKLVLVRKGTELRPGQAAMNAMRLAAPDVHRRITGTELDPFYDDRRLDDFFELLTGEDE